MDDLIITVTLDNDEGDLLRQNVMDKTTGEIVSAEKRCSILSIFNVHRCILRYVDSYDTILSLSMN